MRTSSPPATSDPDDFDALVAEVDYYEHQPSLDREAFDAYVRAESALETIVMGAAASRQKAFEFAGAHELFGRFAQLNEVQREIALRERQAGADADPEYAATLDHIIAATTGAVLLAEGLQDVNRADERRGAADFETAEVHLRSAMAAFARLAEDDDLPLHEVGALRYTLTEAMLQMVTGLSQMRSGDFVGAYGCFDKTGVVFDELLRQASDSADPQFEELRRDLSDGVRYVKAAQSFVETLREAQNGNYPDAVVAGREAVSAYQRIFDEAVSRQVSRNARALTEMELARVRGWLAWAGAELAVDRCRWDECRDLIRQARAQWNEANRVAARLVYLGVMGQRPEAGNTDLLLHSTLRRCDRERNFQVELDTLRRRIDQPNRIEIHAQGGTMSSSTFNGPVTSGSIGDGNRIENTTINAAPDLKPLAAELTELREVLSAAARTPQEQESVTAVVAAGEAAARGDETGTNRHLRAAGRWALETAQQLVLTTAAAAIRSGLG
ncbi:hypothetical protein [Actinoplanes sp. NBRC 103695]|uniref:hypothetical protein n=1 Tax=Actinoplanes sp. NBRC 103695 TaxID=3032202 RepID=UPI0024A0257E|nr:hypothetical protein [Actinoplanes sp. NBRC 103695]GLY98462.1 hypothetical protein Acsp02_57160 [Actinoplanes sp. NBRC 103695]